MFYRKRGWFYQLIWPVTQYIVTNISCTLCAILFFILNRTVVIGRGKVPNERNTLLLSNHQTMIDSFLIGISAYYPQSWIKPFVMPWNPAAEENFFRTPILAFLADNWKCIPIRKGRKDVGAIYRMADALKTSPMILYPEGTRARSRDIGKGRGGAGLLILETRPKVIPVYIDGMDKVLPIGAILPRFFKKVHVYFGEQIDLSKYDENGKTKENAEAIMQEVMDAINRLQVDLEVIKNRGHAYSTTNMPKNPNRMPAKVRDVS